MPAPAVKHRISQTHSLYTPSVVPAGSSQSLSPVLLSTETGEAEPPLPVSPLQGHAQDTWCCCPGPPTEAEPWPWCPTTVMSQEAATGVSHPTPHASGQHGLCLAWPFPLLCMGQRRSLSALSSSQHSPLDLSTVLQPATPWRASPLLLTSLKPPSDLEP